MDRSELLARFLDDETLLSEMVTRLLAGVPPELDSMHAASAAGDAAQMQTLRGYRPTPYVSDSHMLDIRKD